MKPDLGTILIGQRTIYNIRIYSPRLEEIVLLYNLPKLPCKKSSGLEGSAKDDCRF